eukprot:Sspe_Gene.70421::Locus_41576_Transcript_1_1_Confidence_1.000_Length_2622::g.70421::m.70421
MPWMSCGDPGTRPSRARWLVWVCEFSAVAVIAVLLVYLELVQVHQLLLAGSFASSSSSPPAHPPCQGPSCFTVLISTFQRESSALAAIRHYRHCPRVAEVRVAWSESPHPPTVDNPPHLPPAVFEVHWPASTLNVRFLPKTPIHTPAVFSVDDDVRVACSDLLTAHDVWRRRGQDRVVGFFPRVVHPQGGRWRYRGFPSVKALGEYSIVLTKAAFLPTFLLDAYASNSSAMVASRVLVQEMRNCEDIVMQFVAANSTGLPPLFVSPLLGVVDYGSWLFGMWMSGLSTRRAGGQHMMDRSKCVTDLISIWGRYDSHSPLPTSNEVLGGGTWRPATGWEYVSSDLWAPFVAVVGAHLVLCMWMVGCLVFLALKGLQHLRRYHQGRDRTYLPALQKSARVALVVAMVLLASMLLDCCLHPHVGHEPRRPPAPYRQCTMPKTLNLDFRPAVRHPNPKPLRIAVFTGVYAGMVDGVSLTLNRMVRHLLEEGHEVLVFSPDTSPRAIPYHAGELVQVEGLSGWVLGKDGYYYATGIGRRARERLERLNPDLVHLATPDSAAKEAQGWALSKGIPVFCSYHTRFNTYFAYYGWWFLDPVYWFSVRGFFNGCTRVLPPTVAVRDELSANGITSKQSLWPRGVNPAIYNPSFRCPAFRRALAIPEDTPIVLLACRLVLEKDLGAFIKIIHRLRDAGVRFESVIVGDGPARTMMERALPDSIFMAHVNEAEISVVYSSSDIFLYPSTTETWGNVVLEAMSAGLPVVGANASGTAELVIDRETGYLEQPGDYDAFAHRVRELVEDPQKRRVMSREARKRAESLSWERAFGKLLAAYRSEL